MAYFQGDEIRRLIENWAAWSGDGAVLYGVSPIAWSEDQYARREARSNGNVVKVVGVDASLTNDALGDMPGKFAKALKLYYLSSLTAGIIARTHFHCSPRKYYYLVAEAHPEFWHHFQKRRQSTWTK